MLASAAFSVMVLPKEWSQRLTRTKKKRLRTGFTTGTAAAAAVKGALVFLQEHQPPSAVQIDFLTEGHVLVPIQRAERIAANHALCTVIKDAGDDPDVTHRAEIGAEVELADRDASGDGVGAIHITGGRGVGTVTKPGLELPPGEPAINPGPRRMITAAVDAVLAEKRQAFDVHVRIFVPNGEALARKTLNARLGIMGGISILGTTGIVRPMSHAAYTATIRSALSVAAASQGNIVVFTTGRRSERFAQEYLPDLREEQFVQIGDYFRFAMETAAEMAFTSVCITVFFGKALKMAQGIPHTHAAKSTLVLDRLAEWTCAATGDNGLADAVRDANTARQAFDILVRHNRSIIQAVGGRIVKTAVAFAGGRLEVRTIILDYNGRVVSDSAARKQQDRHAHD